VRDLTEGTLPAFVFSKNVEVLRRGDGRDLVVRVYRSEHHGYTILSPGVSVPDLRATELADAEFSLLVIRESDQAYIVTLVARPDGTIVRQGGVDKVFRTLPGIYVVRMAHALPSNAIPLVELGPDYPDLSSRRGIHPC
jgi:hypothetical protein